MKKRLLAAALMAAMTLSTASVLAAPVTFSGDANIEYRNSEASNDPAWADYLTNRIRLNIDAQIDDTFYIHGRAKMTNDLRDAKNGGNTTFDQAYLGAGLKDLDIKVGRQSLAMGKGLLMDDDNFTGAQVTIGAIKGLNVKGFFGKDGVNTKTSFVDMKTSINDINIGASYLKEGDKFFGVNFDTKLTDKAVLNVEYAKNTDMKRDGYLAEIAVGQAAKKGDFAYSVSYRDIEDGALGAYPTNTNFNNSEGFMVKGIYKVSDKATLVAYHDFAETQDGSGKDRTNVEFSVNF